MTLKQHLPKILGLALVGASLPCPSFADMTVAPTSAPMPTQAPMPTMPPRPTFPPQPTFSSLMTTVLTPQQTFPPQPTALPPEPTFPPQPTPLGQPTFPPQPTALPPEPTFPPQPTVLPQFVPSPTWGPGGPLSTTIVAGAQLQSRSAGTAVVRSWREQSRRLSGRLDHLESAWDRGEQEHSYSAAQLQEHRSNLAKLRARLRARRNASTAAQRAKLDADISAEEAAAQKTE